MINIYPFNLPVFRYWCAVGLWCICMSLSAQNPIQKIEYYLDEDPGYGNATNISFTSGTNITANFDISTSALSNGMHLLGIRGHNGKRWSHTHSRLIIVSSEKMDKLEYFWDKDPGIGQATTLNCAKTGNDVTVDFEALCAEVPAGIHTLGVRASVNGVWSQTYTRTVITSPAVATIDKVEYFWDKDPGIGQATILDCAKTGNDVTIDFEALCAEVSTGIHTLGVRASVNGVWSQTYTRTVITSPAVATIDKVEYFWDKDPGIGQATTLDCAKAGNDVTIDFEVLCAEVPAGIHTLGIRVCANGIWSQTYTRTVAVSLNGKVEQVEYFWDQDPGAGKATVLECTQIGNDINFDFEALCAEVPAGIHTLGIRVCANGIWSQTYTRTVAVSMNGTVEQVEYFWNEDPGEGNGIPLPFTKTDGYALVDVESIPTDTLSIGIHALTIRAKANGLWTIPITKIIHIQGEPDFTLSKDTVCVNESLTVTNITGEVIEGTTYEWDMDSDSIADNTESEKFEYSYAKAGDYKVTLAAKLADDITVSASKTITVLPIDDPEITILGNNMVCPGEPTGFKAVGNFGGEAPRYEWYKNNQIVGENRDTITFDDLADGDIIYVKMTSSNPCCNVREVSSEPVTISVDVIPEGSLPVFFPVYTTENTAFQMRGGLPEGGTYYINKVETFVLQPSDYSIGTHQITYRYPSSNGCYGEVSTTLEVRQANESSLLLGDVNKDEVVDIYDVLCAVDIIYGVIYPTYNLQTTDVNKDGTVDVSDIVGIITLIMDQHDKVPHRAAAKRTAGENHLLYVNDLTAEPGSVIPASVTLLSDVWIGGAQFDLSLPDGVTPKASSMDVHVGKVAGETGNTYRIVAYNNALSDLNGSLPFVLRIDETVPEGIYPILITHGVMTDSALKNVLTETRNGILRISRTPTGMTGSEDGIIVVAGNKKVWINGAESGECTLYDVSGRMIDCHKELKQFEAVDVPRTGVYIVRIIKNNRTYEFKVMVK